MRTEMMADVSVVIPHFNAFETIRNALLSVVNQTVPVKEIIIVDDSSDDCNRLLEIIREFSDACNISVIRMDENQGAACARSIGVNQAGGKYIAFLDSDDVWHPEKIALQFEFMERHHFALCGHGYVHDLNKQKMNGDAQRALHGKVTTVNPNHFLKGNPFYTPTVMVRRAGFINFDARYRRLDDYKCWLLNAQQGKAVRLSAVLAGGFKPAIGFSGLTSSFSVMHKSFVGILNDLYREQVISFRFLVIARIIEAVKYPLRVIKSIIRT